jgi:hypothetical protein
MKDNIRFVYGRRVKTYHHLYQLYIFHIIQKRANDYKHIINNKKERKTHTIATVSERCGIRFRLCP